MKTWLLLALLAVTFFSTVVDAHAADPEAIYYANAYADHYGVPRPLVYAIVSQESGWNHLEVSNKGAQGLAQLMPATAQTYGVRNAFSKADNLSGCVRYLRDLLMQFHGDMRLAVAGYYTGESRIRRRGLAFHDPDVVAYVEQVRRRYQRELKLLASSASEEQP